MEVDFYARKLTQQELDMIPEAIDNFKKVVGYLDGQEIDYELLDRLQKLNLKHFKYIGDDEEWNKADFWDTEAWKKFVLAVYLGRKYTNDCDQYSYAILGVCYYIFDIDKKDLHRVSCGTEPEGKGEGHFVSWIRTTSGVLYQLENRIRQPRSIPYMFDYGYRYWHYSTMEPKYIKKDKWLNAKQKVIHIMYETPSALKSDKSSFSFAKAFRIDKSHSLLKEWLSVATGVVTSLIGVITTSGKEVVDTLQANQGNLAQFLAPEYLGALMVVLGLIGVYLRTVTHRDINKKVNYDG